MGRTARRSGLDTRRGAAIVAAPVSLDDHVSPERPFAGGAFHPELPGGRASGTVRLSLRGARFESAAGVVELPLEGLKIAPGGTNGDLVFLTHPAHPQTTLHTADHAIFEHPVVAQTPALAALRGQARAKKRFAGAVLLTLAAVLVLSVAGIFLARGWFVKTAADSVPVAWEIKAGDALFDQLMAGKRPLTDPVLAAQLEALTDPLVTGIADKRYPLKFHIIEEASLNAFAMPGGHVVLHSGLLLAADTPEEIAGVLAHEIAHVTQRHSIRNIISSAGLYLALSAVIGDVSGLLGVLADNSAFLLSRKFSRDFEREADEVGWDYLRASGIDPQGMIAFFKRMQAEQARLEEKMPGGGGVTKALEIASTHPATQERIDRLEKKRRDLSTTETYPALPVNYAEFKAAVRAQLHAPAKDTSR